MIARAGPVVSLTSHGRGVNSVYLSIESIGAGKLKPSRLILWLGLEWTHAQLPDTLKRLQSRGLEICFTEDIGPHTKYYPYVAATPAHETALAIADDDVLYSRSWLQELVTANALYPESVNCHRAHVVALTNQTLAPYNQWKHCRSTAPTFCNMATGVSGCIFPPLLLDAIRKAGTAFRTVCPKADDIWLHAIALRSGFKTRQIRSLPMNYPIVPGSQVERLAPENVHQGRNDQQVQRTYTTQDLALLRSSC